MEYNLQIFKEPRGTIRILQLLVAIIAFSTTAAFSMSFFINCALSGCSLYYPFNMECGISRVHDPIGVQSKAEFFVATGVLSFLYCLLALAVYVFADKLYTENKFVPLADLGATGVLTLFWFAGSCAWAKGVYDVKSFTDPFSKLQCLTGEKSASGGFAGLYISLILGFASFLIWGASMWFVYKETYFHKGGQQVPTRAPQPQQPAAPTTKPPPV